MSGSCQECGKEIARITEIWRAERAIRIEAERRAENLKRNLGRALERIK